MRYLIVEDEDDIRYAVATLIRTRGGEVLEASDGRQALEVFRAEASAGRGIDVALLDFYLPHHKGDVVAEGIRAFADESGVKVPRMIALTGSADADMFGRFKDAGVREFVAKGGDWESLELRLFGMPAAA